MRLLLPLTLIVLLTACSPRAIARPTPPPAPALPTVGEILAAPRPGPVEMIGQLYLAPEGAALAGELHLGPDGQLVPLDTQTLWIGETPPLAPDTPLTQEREARFTVAQASGQLVGPGQFGPQGRYRYSLAEPAIVPHSTRDLSIPLLLDNSALYEGQPVRLAGQLLASRGSTLLVESLGPGGVPDPSALQVKLGTPTPDPALAAALSTSPDGRITYGPVEVTGLWRSGRLIPLAIRPLPQSG